MFVDDTKTMREVRSLQDFGYLRPPKKPIKNPAVDRYLPDEVKPNQKVRLGQIAGISM